ncbi:MAG: ABC transporter permease [Bacillota bacterium]
MIAVQERVRISTAVSAAIVITVAVVGACILTALTLSESYSEHAGTALSSIPSAYFRLAASERKPSFSPSDAEFLRENVEGIDRVALARLISGASFIIGFDPLTGELVDPTVSLESVESSYFPIRNLQLAAGRFFDSADGDARVVVIGASVAEQPGLRLGDLFHYREVVGAFEVVGVLQPVEEVTEGRHWPDAAVNDVVFMPFQHIPVYSTKSDPYETTRQEHLEQQQNSLELWASVKEGYNASDVAVTAQQAMSMPCVQSR